MHEPPGGYGQEPYPTNPQGQGGYPPPNQGQGGTQPYPSQPPYQGGGYPGQNQQPPYQGGGYPGQGQPPYGGQQPPGGGYGPPNYPGQGGGWGPPPEPPRKSSGPMILVAIVAVLVVLGGGGAIVWALSSGDKKPRPAVAESSAVPTPELSVPSFTPPVIPSYTPPTIPGITPSPSGSSTYDESLFVREGDCVKISGKSPKLRMNKLDCSDAPYKVLKRFSGTSDQSKCKSVSGYTTAFYAKSKKYTFLSYVLCLKRQ